MLFDVKIFGLNIVVKILTALFAVLTVAVMTAFIGMFNFNIGYYEVNGYEMRLGAKAVAMLICIFAAVVLPLGKRKIKQ